MGLFDFLFGKKKTSFTEDAATTHRNEDAHKAVMDYLESITGSPEKPAKVENQRLQDGTLYTGEALLLKNGYYLPYGYGKKIVSKEMEMTAHWIDGNVNGMCYLNLHHAMVTGHFKNNHPEGWCLSIEGCRGFVFGVFHDDDCVLSLGESMTWLIRTLDLGLKTSYKKGQILVGEVKFGQARGFHFMNNGDLYVGTDDSQLSKTGEFFKFTKDGRVEIGLFENGKLIRPLSGKEVVLANGGDPKLYKDIDTSKKYF